MYQKSIQMSYEQAAKIANDFLDVFQALYQFEPLRLSNSIENVRTKFKTFTFLPDRVLLKSTLSWKKQGGTTSQKNQCLTDEYYLDIIYTVIWKNRCFEITLFDDPDDFGYCSLLHDYDSSTYVLCDIVEKRQNGDKKYQMTFGFDIEKGTFLELFEVLHYNTVGTLREYPNLDSQLESELKDVAILLN
ncbi:MAG: hypothetical protein IJE68_01120 [Clostridia bacterium]|nr:hypothetical protein [Clostridia bacterium]